MQYTVKDLEKVLEVSNKQTRNIINNFKDDINQNNYGRIEYQKSVKGRGKPKLVMDENAFNYIIAKYFDADLETVKKANLDKTVLGNDPFNNLDRAIKKHIDNNNINLEQEFSQAISQLKFEYTRLLTENADLKETIKIVEENADYMERMERIMRKNEEASLTIQALNFELKQLKEKKKDSKQ